MRSRMYLTTDDAETILAACKDEALRNQWRVSIAVVDEGGFPLAFLRLDGANLQSAEIAHLKARTASVTRTPTKALEEMAKDRPAMLAFPRTPVQGGVPILHDGECLGAIGVSGAKSPEDEQVALAGLGAFARAPAFPPG
jgi:glc operon protein GlcG